MKATCNVPGYDAIVKLDLFYCFIARGLNSLALIFKFIPKRIRVTGGIWNHRMYNSVVVNV